jgi:hypothetical protein
VKLLITSWFLRGLSEVIKRNLKSMSCVFSCHITS